MKRLEIAGKSENLVCFWEDGRGPGKKPLLLCLAGEEQEAQRCLEILSSYGDGAGAAVLVLGSQAEESQVGDWLYSLREREDVDESRITLTGTLSAADWVWRLGSHFPQWFAGICAVGGYGDPYEARAMKDVPLRAYPVKGEAWQMRNGKVVVDVERLVMGILAVGGGQVQERPSNEEDPWRKAMEEDGAIPWLLAQNRKTQFQVTWLKPGVWRIDDWFTASCYLVEGRDKALLIDTGLGEGDLAGLVSTLTPLPVEVAVTHTHGDHMHWIDKFQRVYLHKEDIPLVKEAPENYPGALSVPGASLPELVPIEEGTKLDLGGGVEVEVWELPGHTPHSVVFADHFHRCFFTGDAIGSGYIVLLICPESQAKELVAQYRKDLERFLPRLPQIQQYAWLGGHGIQENGCNLRHQQDYLAGVSQYFNPIRGRVVEDMIQLCDDLLTGKISWEEVLASPEHYCNVGCAGMFFRFI